MVEIYDHIKFLIDGIDYRLYTDIIDLKFLVEDFIIRINGNKKIVQLHVYSQMNKSNRSTPQQISIEDNFLNLKKEIIKSYNISILVDERYKDCWNDKIFKEEV